MATRITDWLYCAVSRPESNQRLVCFPHAGGSASFFRNWGKQMVNYEIYSVCYPGRAERIDEPLRTKLPELATEIADATQALSDIPLVFFGHSMGAAVALETARELERRGIQIVHLIASGSRNGPLPPKIEVLLEDDDSVCEQLVSLGGTSPEIAMDPIFRELVLPAVIADGKMFQAYDMTLTPTLRCPVTTIYGDIDVHADIRPWCDLAPTGFREYVVKGDHFYLITSPPFAILHECLDNAIAMPQGEEIK